MGESYDENSPLLNTGRQESTVMLNNNVQDGEEKKQEEEEIVEKEGPDGGWGWVVVLSSFILTCVLDGICNSFGIIMDPLVKDLGLDPVSVSTVGSVQIAVYFFTGPLAAFLITRYEARLVSMTGSLLASGGLVVASFSAGLPWLMTGYSLVTGLGFGLMYIPAVVAVASYFTKRRALATSICVCGTGFGTFLMPPLVHFLLENYGWRWTFRWLSCICLACILCGASMVPVPSCDSGSEESMHDTSRAHKRRKNPVQRVLCFLSDEDLVMSPRFSLFVTALTGDFLATMSLYIPYTYLPRLAESHGVPAGHAAFLISAAGVSNILGRLLSGWISDRRWVHPLHLTLAVTAMASVPIFLLPWCSSYLHFLVLTSLFGLLTGCWVAAESPLIVSLLHVNLLTPAFGLLTFAAGVAALSGPPLAGLVADLTTPGMALVIAGCVMAASATAYAAASWRHSGLAKREMYQQIA